MREAKRDSGRVAVSDRGTGGCWDAEKRGSTSPSKVYAKRERTADFLLGEESVRLDPEASKVRSELLGRLEYDAGHAQTSSSVSIGGDIVNINRLLSSNLAGFEGFAVDERVR